MKKFLKELWAYISVHPLWTNRLARWTLFSMLALMLWAVVDVFIRVFWPDLVWLSSLVAVPIFLTMISLFIAVWIQTGNQQLAQAENYIREQTALYRHYNIYEVISIVKQFTSIELSKGQAVAIVEKIRKEYDMGPIAAHNLEEITAE